MCFAKQFMFNHVEQELFNLYDALNLLYQFTKIAKIEFKIPKLQNYPIYLCECNICCHGN